MPIAKTGKRCKKGYVTASKGASTCLRKCGAGTSRKKGSSACTPKRQYNHSIKAVNNVMKFAQQIIHELD